MLRAIHRARVNTRYRATASLGRSAPVQQLAFVLEASVLGGTAPVMGLRLDTLATLLTDSDLTGWFDEPLSEHLARWLDQQLRPLAEQHGLWLASVAIDMPNIRCEYHP